MTEQIKALITIVLFALGLAVGWGVQGWRSEARIQSLRADHAKVLKDIAAKVEKARQAVQRAADAANTAINEADKAATERIAKNEEETDRLRACVAAGTCGVRIKTVYVREPGGGESTDSGSGTVGDAGVELDQATGLRVFDLRKSVKLDAEKLDYLRTYAESCWRAGSEAVKVDNDTP